MATTDRLKYISFSNGSAIAVTLPQAGTSGFANNYAFVACDIGAGTATITPTTSTISSSNGSAYTSAAASLALTTGQCAWVYSDNTNYFAIVRAGGSGVTYRSIVAYSPTISNLVGGTTECPVTFENSGANGPCLNTGTAAAAGSIIGAGTVVGVFLHFSVAPGANVPMTVMKNGSATSMTCTVTSAITDCSDTTHTFTVNDTDTVGYEFVNTTLNAGSVSMVLKIQN